MDSDDDDTQHVPLRSSPKPEPHEMAWPWANRHILRRWLRQARPRHLGLRRRGPAVGRLALDLPSSTPHALAPHRSAIASLSSLASPRHHRRPRIRPQRPGFVVIDEVAGQWIALLGCPSDWRHALIAWSCSASSTSPSLFPSAGSSASRRLGHRRRRRGRRAVCLGSAALLWLCSCIMVLKYARRPSSQSASARLSRFPASTMSFPRGPAPATWN